MPTGKICSCTSVSTSYWGSLKQRSALLVGCNFRKRKIDLLLFVPAFYQAELSVHSSLEPWVILKCIIIINIATYQHGKGPHKSTLRCDVIKIAQTPPGQVSPRALLGEHLSHVLVTCLYGCSPVLRVKHRADRPGPGVSCRCAVCLVPQ